MNGNMTSHTPAVLEAVTSWFKNKNPQVINVTRKKTVKWIDAMYSRIEINLSLEENIISKVHHKIRYCNHTICPENGRSLIHNTIDNETH